MVSDQGLSYAIGNLLAGPSQWRKMYSTGSVIVFSINILLVYLNILSPLYISSNPDYVSTVEILVLELLNAMIPVVAIAVDRPMRAILTVIAYVFVGLFVWTIRYDSATGGF